MAKTIETFIKLQVKGGQANPSPPIGPALGSKGLNIMEFCKRFNAQTQDKMGQVVPVIITVYSDKSFDFVLKTPPAAVLIKEAIKLETGSAESNRKKSGQDQLGADRGYRQDQNARPQLLHRKVCNDNDCRQRAQHGRCCRRYTSMGGQKLRIWHFPKTIKRL